jgi:hypothetical protein
MTICNCGALGAPAASDEQALTFRLEAGELQIHVAADAREDGLALTLTFHGAEQQALTGARLRMRRNGRLVLSTKLMGMDRCKRRI